MSEQLVDYKSTETWLTDNDKTIPKYLVTELSDMRVFSVYDTVFQTTHNVTLNMMTLRCRCTCNNQEACKHITQVKKALNIYRRSKAE